VLVHGGKVSLNRQLVWLDTWAFEQAAKQVHVLCGLPDLGSRQGEWHKSVDQALSLYGGPLLGDEEAAWAAGPREHYRRILQRLVTAASQAAQKMNWHEESVEMSRRGLECHPPPAPPAGS
jgi:LuxR family transcriptional regulator, maltose regulon positive regulatory protein